MEEKKILNGKKVADEVLLEVEKDCENLAKMGISPRLEIILTGNDDASKIYTSRKLKTAESLGITANLNHFENPKFEEIEKKISEFNDDKNIHGMIIQLPLVENLQKHTLQLCSKIHYTKDVDGLSSQNCGMLNLGFEQKNIAFHTPCTPTGCLYLLKKYGISISGKKCLVINRSNIVGKPLAAMLLQNDAFVQIAHNMSGDFSQELKYADIIFSATGIANFINKDMIKPGCVLVDIGISRNNGKICGDFDKNCIEIADFITPVPGGIGPMTIAFLMKNVVNSAKNFVNI